MSGKKIGDNARDQKITSYVSPQEREGILKLGSDYAYQGTAGAIRAALAYLIEQKHPELSSFLRKDLVTPLDKAL